MAVAVIVALAAVIGLVAFFSGRDSSGVSSKTPSGSGQAFPDQGTRRLAPGQRPPVPYNSSPPTSGPHVSAPVTRDGMTVTDDQLLTALEAGNVVLLYGTATEPPALRALATDLGGAFDPSLARAGQAVILARRPGTSGVVAVAWRHLLRASSARDPALRTFADDWLGRGAKGT